MTKSKRHASIRPSHPAEIIVDAIATLGVSKTKFAAALGISRQTLYDLLDQKQGVSAAMAVRLSAVVGSSPEFWLNLQTAHDLWQASRDVDVSRLRKLEPAE
jgi:antitoxin HigA-1